jgi:phosphonate transport system permease protein
VSGTLDTPPGRTRTEPSGRMGAPRQVRYRWGIAVLVLAMTAAIIHLDLRPEQLAGGFSNLLQLWDDAFPPQMGLLPTAATVLIETLTIALLGTVFGFVLALPFGLAGARSIAPVWLFVPARALSAAVRTLPSLLWAVLFVIVVGFQPLAGVLAMTMYTMGHLAKLQYESLEGLPPEPLEVTRATGAGFFQLARFVALPEASNLLISQILYMFEYNVRASAIVGFVGAGGIGFYINQYLRAMQYDGVLTLLLVVFLTVLVIDVVSFQIRSRFLGSVPG